MIRIAKSRGLDEGVRELRLAKADLIAAAKGPFSAKERKALGPIADLMENESQELSESLHDELVALLMDRATGTIEKMKQKIRAEHGNSGVMRCEEFCERWYLDMVERSVMDRLSVSLEDRMGELETASSDSTTDEVATSDDESKPRTAQSRHPGRNRRRAVRGARGTADGWRKQGFSEQADRLDRVADTLAAR